MSRTARLVKHPVSSLTRGLTLAEVLVSAFLLVLFLGIVARFFQLAQRVSHEELERNRAEAILLHLSGKLRRDMAVASVSGLSLTSSKETLLIHPVDLTDVGSVFYGSRLILWQFDPAKKQVRRAEADPYSGSTIDGTPYRANETDLATIATSSEFQTTGLFPGITKFQILTNPEVESPFIGSPLVMEVDVETPLSRSRKVITLREVFHLRNSGS